MKAAVAKTIVALGLIVGAGRTGNAQQLSLEAQLSSEPPIIISLSQIDHDGVSVMSDAKDIDGAKLGLPYRGMKKADVDALVKDGLLLRRPVWIMDGQKIVAKCGLIGEYGYKPQWESETKYGLLLGFVSVGEAQRVGTILKPEPSVDELTRRQDRWMNNERSWIF